ncbi:MAG: CoA transferase, partial [Pseudomonadota bacterium]|nr:CoA transferase [Pseudomonadota bacterium]
VMLGLQNEREWKAFCAQVLLRPELADDARFSSNAARAAARDVLRALIIEVFAGMSTQEVLARLDRSGIANAQVNQMAQVWAHPQLQARGRWVQVDTPAGPIPALLPPGAVRSDAVRMDDIPALGQHTRTILAGIGYTDEQIDRLQRDGAL